MPNFNSQLLKLSRRRLLQVGVGGLVIAAATGGYHWTRQRAIAKSVAVPPIPQGLPTYGNSISPMQLVRDFDYGTVKQENGRTVREFQIIAENSTLQLNSAVSYITWDYNGRVPGPTLRAREGERVRVLFLNKGGHAHTMHFHGIHPANVDGVRPVSNGNAFIYEFDAAPYGVHLYHCHIPPVTRHIGKGLHGMFIVDPKVGRPPADELVLVMSGYDINNDQRNELYAFNGLPNYYMDHPIPIYQNQLIRLYVLNMVDFAPALTFHLHANFFRVYPTGMTLHPSHETDVITMGVAERHILEFSYPYAGKFMFHPHQDAIAEMGCMGLFDVVSTQA
jgi:FtsP/CotA-like multicopper oxidase with cupredoxin domain